MYDILIAEQEDRMKVVQAEQMIPNWKEFRLLFSQLGIGKKWFLSYVLVQRLLEGKPTIFQAADHANNDITVTVATHYLINANGVYPMAVSE